MATTFNNALSEALNQPWTGFIAIKSVEKKHAKNGTTFYRVTLFDGKLPCAANIFEDRVWFPYFANQQWRTGDHFKVQGKISVHAQYGRQIEIAQMRLVEERDHEDGYQPGLFWEQAPIDHNAYWEELQKQIQSLKPDPLRQTVESLFVKHGDDFKKAAAAKQAHHAYYGGLLQHTVMMLREADAIMNVPDFPPMNRSLVIAGILLHDLAKIAEMEVYPRTEYTEAGNLLGHTHLVLTWLNDAGVAHQLNDSILLHLKHIILSHHGQHEFGAAVLPQTREAMLVHIIDNLDAKIQMIHYALKKLSDDETVSEKLWMLDNRAFRKSPEC